MSQDRNKPVEYIRELMNRARKAQKIAEGFSQEKVDELAAAITWEIVANDKLVQELAEFSYDECRLGDVQSKYIKVTAKCRGVYFDVKDVKTVGICEEIKGKGLVRISKPAGVIGSLVPSTQSEMHPLIQAIFAVKARDAVIFSPHPRGKRTCAKTVQLIRDVMKKYDAPEDLFIPIEEPSIPLTNELMSQCDLVMATGGQPMVHAAYSSGTPAYGVGAGNSMIHIDKTADLADAAVKIKASKTFDTAAGCSCDNSIIIDETVYDAMLDEFKKVGAHMLNTAEKAKVQKAIWPNWPADHVLNRDIVASPIENIVKIAGIEVPEGTSFLLVEEEKTGEATPFSGEKMSLVSTIYKSSDIDEVIRISNENHAYSGAGHSVGIYSKTPENIDKYALETYTTRVVVNQAQGATNTGSWTSGMPFTSSLGCGTWGGNSVSENIELKHYMNNTWVIREIPSRQPTDEELFAGFTARK
ncbi:MULTISPECIES: aldehyde dehydrogenase family protein [unclassified Oceanispirochaeta]|uniref:aldehyde dehydrogenase family protein n=1 Tax=unclassified Oceanispirochaeta TaxID=2635722 RepID=UPI000E098E95|nr:MULTISPECIES: aldehyde dehydrogenase family protein [unclassified Oceanispirochaeta]MBF9016960.1 aldehyde dehydrogenase family protein [Oceanispirochaeta sp. M2]NPD73323.1 aldehyde dehydrogenase family protein [Oceanispirochaeta sp. M1]RDG30984.1 aldehyde dehydrogenase family protein [Oceanispirochaeta sp. M1]